MPQEEELRIKKKDFDMGLAGGKHLLLPAGTVARTANAAVERAKPAEGGYVSSAFGIPTAEI